MTLPCDHGQRIARRVHRMARHSVRKVSVYDESSTRTAHDTRRSDVQTWPRARVPLPVHVRRDPKDVRFHKLPIMRTQQQPNTPRTNDRCRVGSDTRNHGKHVRGRFILPTYESASADATQAQRSDDTNLPVGSCSKTYIPWSAEMRTLCLEGRYALPGVTAPRT